jgi:hypothetical protein
MNELTEITILSRRLRNLARAVIVLGIISLISLAVSIATLLCTHGTARWPGTLTSSRALGMEDVTQQLRIASVVALTKWTKQNADDKAVLIEILKKRPAVNFSYQINDAVREANRPMRDGVDYGEGELLFFTGTPLRLSYSVAYADGKLRDNDRTSLEAVREVLRNSPE